MKRILVPIDFSSTAATALNYAQRLAEAKGIDLELIHVHDGYPLDKDSEAKWNSPEVRQQVLQRMNDFILKTVERPYVADMPEVTADDLVVTTREVVGAPASEIVKQSRAEGISLIVMGGVGTGRTSTVTPIYGSVARDVTERAACPVLLIPRSYEGAIAHRVALAFDTMATLRQLAKGFETLRQAIEPTIHFARVQEENAVVAFENEAELLEQFVDSGFPGYPVELDILEPGDIPEVLVNYSIKRHIDLLVVGGHRRGFFGRLFLHSNTSPVIENTRCPVLVVPLQN